MSPSTEASSRGVTATFGVLPLTILAPHLVWRSLFALYPFGPSLEVFASSAPLFESNREESSHGLLLPFRGTEAGQLNRIGIEFRESSAFHELLSPSAYSRPGEATYPQVFHNLGYVALLGFLNLPALCSSPDLPALFRAGPAPGVLPFKASFLQRAACVRHT